MTSGDLVPIRLDIAVGQQRFQDTFCWSTAETQEGAENFAAALCRDNSLPQATVPSIVSAIKQQVASVGDCSPVSIDGRQNERNEIIRLDIRLGSQTLHDELVWDVNSTEHDPDSFAAVLCKDLSADKAFVPLVAWHIRQQVHEYRRTGQSSTPRSILDPAATDKPQTATRRTRRKLSVKQPADAGFKSTYSSGVVRRPEEWRQWTAHVASADTPLLPTSVPAASTAHSQGGISAVPLQKAHNAATSQSHGSPQFPGRSTTALSGHSQHQLSGQAEPVWNQPYSQQQTQQAFWMQRQQQQQQQQQEQQQQQQYTAVFIQQAQAIWERMHMSTMGITMPRTYDEAETVVKAVQRVQQTQQQASATSPSTQSRFAPKAVPGQFQDVSMRAGSAGYGPGFTYSTSQAPHGQMNPLLMDYAGLQYPGY
ncbi:SWI SNF, matrix associated, actin dependent regulator of chromatin, subfamily b, member 1 [Trebouxia sp. C0009 RCD-2024]